MTDSDKVARAYSRLVSLQKNLPNGHVVQETYVEEYHAPLSQLEAIAFDVGDFRVPSEQVKRIVVGGNYLTKETHYSDKRFVERAYLMLKL